MAGLIISLIIWPPFIARSVFFGKHSEKPAEPVTTQVATTTQATTTAPVTVVPKPAVIPSTVKPYSKEEVKALIQRYSDDWNISSEIPLRIANCESGFNWNSKNKNSTASGVFQFIASTWRNQPEGKEGYSVFDADANVRAAIRLIATSGTSPWNASASCWRY